MSEEPLERSREALEDAREAAAKVAATEPFPADDPAEQRKSQPDPQATDDERADPESSNRTRPATP